MPPLPVLLPQGSRPSSQVSQHEWRPKRDLSIPLPAPQEDSMTQEQQMAMARVGPDGKVKKVRPRRTVDYGGPMGRWALVSICIDSSNEYILILSASYESCDRTKRMCRSYGLRRHISSTYDWKQSMDVLYLQLKYILLFLQLLPPKAYPENASTSLCTKFVHTSTNKIRCPVNCVTVRNIVHVSS